MAARKSVLLCAFANSYFLFPKLCGLSGLLRLFSYFGADAVSVRDA